MSKMLKTLLFGIGLAIVVGNPTNSEESNVSSNMMNTVVEKEIVSLRTISLDDTITSSKENSKKATIKSVTPQKKYLSIEEVKDLTNEKMDLSKPSGLSKKEFVKLISNMKYDYTGVFKRNAGFIWKLAHKYKFNEIFFMAIIANESLWGASELAMKNNNYTSQMEIVEKEQITEDGEKEIIRVQKIIFYPTERECFKETARNLRKNYLTKGRRYYAGTDIYSINESYCEPGVHKDGTLWKYMWAEDTYRCMEMILGIDS